MNNSIEKADTGFKRPDLFKTGLVLAVEHCYFTAGKTSASAEIVIKNKL